MVRIIVPIFKENPTSDDTIALNRLKKILGKYAITIVHPFDLSLDNYTYLGFENVGFEKHFFDGIQGYNKLMLNTIFYKKFTEKYLLIYQTDCFVFQDQLEYWCLQNYDYIGAPWIRSHNQIPLPKKIWDYSLYHFLRIINYNKNGNTQKNKALLYNTVGNGGLSLRKREKCIEILESIPDVVEIYLKNNNQENFFVEDVFFSIEPLRNNISFNIPNYKIACSFSIENKPNKAMKIIDGKLPFGCHRWNKENRNYWKNYF